MLSGVAAWPVSGPGPCSLEQERISCCQDGPRHREQASRIVVARVQHRLTQPCAQRLRPAEVAVPKGVMLQIRCCFDTAAVRLGLVSSVWALACQRSTPRTLAWAHRVLHRFCGVHVCSSASMRRERAACMHGGGRVMPCKNQGQARRRQLACTAFYSTITRRLASCVGSVPEHLMTATSAGCQTPTRCSRPVAPDSCRPDR